MLLAAWFTVDGLKVLSFLGSHGEDERMLGPAWHLAPGGTGGFALVLSRDASCEPVFSGRGPIA